VSCKTRLFRGLCRMFRQMLRRNRVIEVTLLLAAVPLLSRGGLGVVQVDKEKCPPRLEGHDEHSSFDQYDRPSTIEPIGITRQSRFITVASGNVIATTNALGLVQEVFAVAVGFRGVLIDCNGNRLDMLEAPSLAGRQTADLGERLDERCGSGSSW
jgi:hypothetical protein